MGIWGVLQKSGTLQSVGIWGVLQKSSKLQSVGIWGVSYQSATQAQMQTDSEPQNAGGRGARATYSQVGKDRLALALSCLHS